MAIMHILTHIKYQLHLHLLLRVSLNCSFYRRIARVCLAESNHMDFVSACIFSFDRSSVFIAYIVAIHTFIWRSIVRRRRRPARILCTHRLCNGRSIAFSANNGRLWGAACASCRSKWTFNFWRLSIWRQFGRRHLTTNTHWIKNINGNDVRRFLRRRSLIDRFAID